MKYIVYQTTNKENGKLYIGVHKTENPDIFDGYIGNGIKVGYSLENPKTTFQFALKKYGYSSFVRSTLRVFDNEEDAYEMEAQIVTLDFIRQDSNYNIKTGGIHGSWNWKNLYQFDYNGKLIKTWDSVSEVIEYYSCNSNRFNMAATNKYSAFESYWSLNDSIDPTEYRKSKLSEVYQFTQNGELINVFKGHTDAARKLDINSKSIEEACRLKKLYKQSYWTKNPDDIFNVIKLNKLFNLSNKAIIMYDVNREKINEFNSITEASKILKIQYGTIKRAILVGSLCDLKYYFSYVSPIKKNSTKIEQYDFKTGELVKI